jgi:hypothetical protein
VAEEDHSVVVDQSEAQAVEHAAAPTWGGGAPIMTRSVRRRASKPGRRTECDYRGARTDLAPRSARGGTGCNGCGGGDSLNPGKRHHRRYRKKGTGKIRENVTNGDGKEFVT